MKTIECPVCHGSGLCGICHGDGRVEAIIEPCGVCGVDVPEDEGVDCIYCDMVKCRDCAGLADGQVGYIGACKECEEEKARSSHD